MDSWHKTGQDGDANWQWQTFAISACRRMPPFYSPKQWLTREATLSNLYISFPVSVLLSKPQPLCVWWVHRMCSEAPSNFFSYLRNLPWVHTSAGPIIRNSSDSFIAFAVTCKSNESGEQADCVGAWWSFITNFPKKRKESFMALLGSGFCLCQICTRRRLKPFCKVYCFSIRTKDVTANS